MYKIQPKQTSTVLPSQTSRGLSECDIANSYTPEYEYLNSCFVADNFYTLGSPLPSSTKERFSGVDPTFTLTCFTQYR